MNFFRVRPGCRVSASTRPCGTSAPTITRVPGGTDAARRRRTLLLGVLAVAAVAFTIWAVAADLDASVAVATLGGLLVSVASLAVAILQLFPPVRTPQQSPADAALVLGDDIRAHWLREARARGIRDQPAILPVVWTVVRSSLSDPDQPQHAWATGGRIEGEFDAVAAQFATGFQQVENGRLVILGEPGSGKTAMAMLLTVGLLGSPRPIPSPTDPVPVLLSASTWNPVNETLDEWIVRAVAEAYFHNDPTVARMLLDNRLLLPVVDGLDEILEVVRRTAIQRINDVLGGSRPIVVTCRRTEFEDLIRDGAPVLHRAPVVRVEPVSAPDAGSYLQRAVAQPNSPEWGRLATLLGTDPSGPLARALSTPLMISLLVAVHGGTNPGGTLPELLDDRSLTSRRAVEDHLLDRTISATFRGPGAGLHACTSDQADRWLRFLAVYLHGRGDRDLRWWTMSERLLPRLAILGAALVLGVLVIPLEALAVAPVVNLRETLDPDASYSLGTAGLYGIVVALLTVLVWYAVPVRSPARFSRPTAVPWPRVRRSLLVGLAAVGLPAAAVLVVTLLTRLAWGGWSYAGVHDALLITVMGTAGGLALGCGLAVDSALTAAPESSSQPSAARFLRDDRRSSLAGLAIVTIIVAIALALLELAALVLGDRLAHTVAAHVGAGRQPDGMWPPTQVAEWPTDRWILHAYLLAHAGLLAGLLVLVTRAWPRFTATRIYLAARGALPWRFPAFLAEAQARGLLRESAGAYQFRHVRLQERLATQPDPGRVVPTSAPWPVRRRRALLATSAALVLLAVTTMTVLHGPARAEAINLRSPTPLPSDYPEATALSGDGTKLAAAYPALIVYWRLDLDARIGRRYADLPLARLRAGQIITVHALALSSDGARMALADDTQVFLIETASGAVLDSWPYSAIRSLAFSRDGAQVAGYARSGVVQTFLPSGQRGQAFIGGAAENPTLAFGPGASDGTLVTCDEGTVVTVRTPSGYSQPWQTGHIGAIISAMAFTDDGTTLVTGSNRNTVRFLTIGTGASARPPLQSAYLSGIAAVALPDGTADRIVVADGNPAVEMWTF
jgi:hypothetical protein